MSTRISKTQNSAEFKILQNAKSGIYFPLLLLTSSDSKHFSCFLNRLPYPTWVFERGHVRVWFGATLLLAAAVVAAYAGQNEDEPDKVATVCAAASAASRVAATASATVEYEHKKNQVTAIATTTV